MNTLSERLKSAVAFNAIEKPSAINPARYGAKADQTHHHREFGRETENARLRPILDALIECAVAAERVRRHKDCNYEAEDILHEAVDALERLVGEE